MTCNNVTYLIPLGGCKYVDRSQWDYFTKDYEYFLILFHLFHMKEF